MVAIIAIILMIAIDQAVKYWSVAVLSVAPNHSIPVIQDVFHLTYVENRGAAFSILQDKVWLFVILTLLFLGCMLYAIKRNLVRTTLGRWSLVILAGGALGNLIDRVLRHYVVDMFDFRLIGFPVFNVADIFVCVGGAMLAYYWLFQHDKAAK